MIENLEVSERLDKIRDSKMNIILRYPLKSWIGQGRQIAKARWLSYFDFYGFRRPSTQTGATINTIAHFNGVRHDTTYWKSFEVLVFKPDPDK